MMLLLANKNEKFDKSCFVVCCIGKIRIERTKKKFFLSLKRNIKNIKNTVRDVVKHLQ
jgi:hypothetical protein